VVALTAALSALLLSGVIACPSALLLRIACPGCGMTRATLALASGRLADAIALHPAAPLAVPALALCLGAVAVRYVRTASAAFPRWTLPLLGVAAAVTVAVWTARLLGAWGGPLAV
jgi:hypothetical protein